MSARALLEHHREHLRRSAISDDIIAATGYFSVGATAELAECGWGRSTRLASLLPGLAIPVRGAASEPGHIAYVVLRPDAPLADADGKPRKYEHPSKSSARLDVHPSQRDLLTDRAVRVWFTEGTKKRDALASIGEFAIALSGVYGWKGAEALTDLDAVLLRGREAVIAFDSDVATNLDVRTAALRFGRLLEARGAAVRYLILEEAA